MRVHERPKLDKKTLQEGTLYPGKIVDYKIMNFTTRFGPGYGLKLHIKPDDDTFFRAWAFDYIGHDEDGPFVYKDSLMNKWLCNIFGIQDISKIILEQAKNRPCLFAVKNSLREFKDKEGNATKRVCADVIDVLPPTSNAIPTNAIPTKTTEKTVAPRVLESVEANISSNKLPKAPKVSDDWGDGESL
jgi:hypothetical protein